MTALARAIVALGCVASMTILALHDRLTGPIGVALVILGLAAIAWDNL